MVEQQIYEKLTERVKGLYYENPANILVEKFIDRNFDEFVHIITNGRPVTFNENTIEEIKLLIRFYILSHQQAYDIKVSMNKSMKELEILSNIVTDDFVINPEIIPNYITSMDDVILYTHNYVQSYFRFKEMYLKFYKEHQRHAENLYNYITYLVKDVYLMNDTYRISDYVLQDSKEYGNCIHVIRETNMVNLDEPIIYRNSLIIEYNRLKSDLEYYESHGTRYDRRIVEDIRENMDRIINKIEIEKMKYPEVYRKK